MRGLWLLVLLVMPLRASVVRQMEAYQRVGDPASAVQLAEEALQEAPTPELRRAYVAALAAQGADVEAVAAYRAYATAYGEDIELMEAVAWSIINRGAMSHAPQTQLAAMLGAAVTRDVQAVPILVHHLRGKNALLRAVAAQLSPMMRDVPLKVEVERLISSDPRWEVRAEAIRAAGALHMTHLQGTLEELIASRKASAEEKVAALQSVVTMLDIVDHDHLTFLATHKRAGLRRLSCELVAHLDLNDEARFLVPLLQDPIPGVRKGALTALGLLQQATADEVRPLLDDHDWSVALTAAWAMTLAEPETGLHRLGRALQERPERARVAAAALARTGERGIALMQKQIASHSDPYVRANLALGLIGQRVDTREASQTLYEVFLAEEGRWMFDDEHHALFRALAPSRLRHGGSIPNRPEVVNQLTRLEVLGVLAVLEHPGAQEAVKRFLGGRGWGITGIAAVTLVEEGDEAALELVRDLLNDPDRNVRVQAALALAVWGKDPSAVSVLEEAYPQAHRELKVNIIEAVASIASPDSIPFLLQTLDEPFSTLRIFAAAALIHCLNA